MLHILRAAFIIACSTTLSLQSDAFSTSTKLRADVKKHSLALENSGQLPIAPSQRFSKFRLLCSLNPAISTVPEGAKKEGLISRATRKTIKKLLPLGMMLFFILFKCVYVHQL